VRAFEALVGCCIALLATALANPTLKLYSKNIFSRIEKKILTGLPQLGSMLRVFSEKN
jgi:hypothetical protein